ncbi:oligo-1,6-glucosidase [Curtobacterium sp. PhB130]|uniref:glycoside hydrolase family 13 protein n=1 Tax=Curtobacterium sp. PhB130 TaxID=2485178 RepID=UPI000FB2C45A|nr:alpha-glucosidase [Curtobacterium sp. PhB130]ROS76301.1 oligo-1,6-glucosidase [Curtobacterium sp. PhB130]
MSGPEPWWTDAVVYQVYPRSFADGNGDGVGDLAGLRQHLDHIADLGVDVIWLSPVYRSPQADNGYDISDYEDIDPLFGTIDEFDALLVEVHRRGMKLVMDLVVNHSSDQHPWFRAAKLSRACPKHDWYIWRDPVDGHEPNEWRAAFGGPAWSWDPGTGQYYLHMFTPQQPDLNWDNPDLRAAVYAMMNGWLDRGVDGFRMDVINHIAKDPASLSDGSAGYVMQPRIHDHLQEMHERVFAGRDALLTVGEMPGVTVADAALFTDPERRELDMVFQFEHVGLDHGPDTKFDNRPFDLPALKTSLARWQTGLAESGWNSLYLANHDQPRPVSRFGAAAVAAAAGFDADPFTLRYESATLLATVLHLHRGTPYVYQGDEIGMVNAGFERIEDYRDIESLNWFRGAVGRGTSIPDALDALAFRSRDNARTPIPWDDSAPAGGFSAVTPWIGMGQGWPSITVAADRAAGDRSVFDHHRRLIDLRHASRTVRLGEFALLEPDHPSLWAFTRTLVDESEPPLVVVANLSSSVVMLPAAISSRLETLVLGNLGRPEVADELRPWEARVHEFGPA